MWRERQYKGRGASHSLTANSEQHSQQSTTRMARSLSLVLAVVACLAVMASCSQWGGVYPLHHKGYPHQVPDLGALSDPYNPYHYGGHGYHYGGHGYPGAWHGYPGWGKPWSGAYPYGHHW